MNAIPTAQPTSSQPLGGTNRVWRRRRLAILLLVAAAILLGTIGYIEFFLRRPIGSGPAGPAVPLEPFTETWTERPVLLLGVGDSVTRGLGADGEDHSYFNRLARNPNDEWKEMQGRSLSAVLPNLETENLSISGTTSLAHATMLEQLEEPYDPEIFGLVVMTTGGNDLIHNYGRTPPREGAMYGATLQQAEPWIANFEIRLQRMIDRLNELFPGGCKIFLGDIYDPTDGVGDAPSIFLPDWDDGLAIHAAYNEIIHRIGAERDNVHIVPLYETFLGHGSHCRQFWRQHYCADDPHYWFYDNVEDPNDRGYDAIRRVFLNVILANVDPIRSSPVAELAMPPRP